MGESPRTLLTTALVAALMCWQVIVTHDGYAETTELLPGTLIRSAEVDRVRPYLPPEIHPYTIDNFPGLEMRVVTAEDYRPHPKYLEATTRFACQASLDDHGQLQNYTAGQPFPYSDWATEATGHACDLTPDDPRFALKLAWNVNYRWNGGGINMRFAQSFWREAKDNTWKIAQGTYQRTYFSGRSDLLPETTELVSGTDIEWAEFSEMVAPFDVRGSMFMVLRYRDAVGRGDDAWAYVPTLRRVRRISTEQKSDSLQGSEFTLEDVMLFSGYVWDQEWSFGGEHHFLATMDSERQCYPLNAASWKRDAQGKIGDDRDFNQCAFGPYKALPFVDESWQLRNVLALEYIPNRGNHPYSRRTLWYDKQTFAPLYALSFDQEGMPLRLSWYLGDWSETGSDVNRKGKRVVLISAAAVVNVQQNVSNLSQNFAAEATSLSSTQAERYYDFTRLKERAK